MLLKLLNHYLNRSYLWSAGELQIAIFASWLPTYSLFFDYDIDETSERWYKRRDYSND